MKQKSLIGVVGSGMIGTSLAVLFTGNGYPTALYVANPEKKELRRSQYDACFANLIAENKITPAQAEICSRYLTITCNYADLSESEYVFEAVTEALEAKHEVYGHLERHCRKLKALASTSSAFSASTLSQGLTALQDRFLVAHPFNPPHVVLFFEIVKAPGTPQSVMEDMAALLRGMHRKVVCLKKDFPGCIGNRLQYVLFREAINLVEQGVSTPEDIDLALRYSFMPRYTRMGLFEHLDNAGLDLFQSASNTLYPTLCDTVESQDMVNKLVDAGNLGCKSGEGFYKWDAGKIDALRKRAMEPYLETFCWSIPEE